MKPKRQKQSVPEIIDENVDLVYDEETKKKIIQSLQQMNRQTLRWIIRQAGAIMKQPMRLNNEKLQ